MAKRLIITINLKFSVNETIKLGNETIVILKLQKKTERLQQILTKIYTFYIIY